MSTLEASMTTNDDKAPPAAAASTAAKPSNTTPQKRKNNSNNNRRRGGKNDKRPKDSNNNNNNNSSSNNICFQWAKNGSCSRGDSCRFAHETEPDETNRDPTNDAGATATEDASKKKSNSNRRRRNNKQNKNKSNNQQQEEVVKDEEMKDSHGNDINKEEDDAPTNNGNNNKPHITKQKFADLPHISAESRRALSQVFGYEFMTVVQAETLPVILEGNDCLAKAKTGTGKTLAFMIPAVEKLLEQRTKNSNKINNMDISCLIISPTRELTFQIRTEAQNLLKFHKNMRVVACVGGTNINADRKVLQESVQFVVATPGRLLDHLTNTETKSGLRLADRMKSLQVLILDEADQLLDMGFRPDIQRILNILQPSRATRQTLLFSATVPDSVAEIAHLALQSPHKYVDTVGHDQEQTHLHVEQQLYVTLQGAEQIRAIWQILAAETAQANKNNEPYKIIVFFTTARLTGFMAELFNSMTDQQRGFDKVLEIHSRKSQAVRQKASDKFRKATKGAVLFSSDVSARGMDYPDVTFVLQVGLTNRAQYIHRLGRTARAGKHGKGALLLAAEEEKYMVQTELQDMPLVKVPVIPGADAASANVDDCPIMQALSNVVRDKELKESAEQAYRAWLGYYNGHLRKVGWNKRQLVVAANQWAKDIGIPQPKMQKKTIGKMGLKGVPGLLVE